MIPEGTYAAVVAPVNSNGVKQYCQFGESGQKRTPLVSVQFEIIRGDQAGERVTWYGYFTDNDENVDRVIKALRACGFAGDDFASFVEQEVDQEVQIVIQHEEYRGRMQVRVAWVNPVGGSGLKVENQMVGSDLRMFSARFASRLKAVAPVKGQKAVREEPGSRPAADPSDATNGVGWAGPAEDNPPSGRGHGGGSGDDDIPF